MTDCRFFVLRAEDFGCAVREWFPMAAHLLEGQIQGYAARRPSPGTSGWSRSAR